MHVAFFHIGHMRIEVVKGNTVQLQTQNRKSNATEKSLFPSSLIIKILIFIHDIDLYIFENMT